MAPLRTSIYAKHLNNSTLQKSIEKVSSKHESPLNKKSVDSAEEKKKVAHLKARIAEQSASNETIPKFDTTKQPKVELSHTRNSSFLNTDRLKSSSTFMPYLERVDKNIFKSKEIIAVGSIGSQITTMHWNRASNTLLGTNKSPALRFDQYCGKTDITAMINVHPHDKQFEPIDKLPLINSKFKNSSKVSIKKQISREQALPRNAGNTVNTTQPNSPSRTQFYTSEIPKYYEGQPGFKKHLKETARKEDLVTKPSVEWKTNMWGTVQAMQTHNLPGFTPNKNPKVTSIEYLKLIKTAAEDEENFNFPKSPEKKQNK